MNVSKSYQFQGRKTNLFGNTPAAAGIVTQKAARWYDLFSK